MFLFQELDMEKYIFPNQEDQEIHFEIHESCDRYPFIVPGENINLYRDEEKMTAPELITENTILQYEFHERKGDKRIEAKKVQRTNWKHILKWIFNKGGNLSWYLKRTSINYIKCFPLFKHPVIKFKCVFHVYCMHNTLML